MIIIITGTPCTGKTSVSEELAKIMKKTGMAFNVIHLNDIVLKNRLYAGTDKKRNAKDVDMKKLRKHLKAVTGKGGNFIIESHFAHDLEGDIVFVLRTNPVELERRMEEKEWAPEKIEENLEAERLNLIFGESVDFHSHKVFEINTTGKTALESAKEMSVITWEMLS